MLNNMLSKITDTRYVINVELEIKVITDEPEYLSLYLIIMQITIDDSIITFHDPYPFGTNGIALPKFTKWNIVDSRTRKMIPIIQR